MRCFAEANAAHIKVTKVAVSTATLKASTHDATLELWREERLYNE